jgi:hypothetical protein
VWSHLLMEDMSFQEVLSWLDSRLGDVVGLTVADRNWSVSFQGPLAVGPGERQLVDHLGGIVRDYLLGEARVQLCEDDVDRAAMVNDLEGAATSLFLHMRGGAQVNFGARDR